MAMKLPIVEPQIKPLERVSPTAYSLTGYERNSQDEITFVNLPVLTNEQISKCISSYTPLKVTPNVDQSGYWIVTQAQLQHDNKIPLTGMSGEFYLEADDGVYNNADETNRRRIFNFKVTLARVVEIWSLEGLCRRQFVCLISSEVWGNQSREIVIASEKYKDLFKEIHKRFPEIFLQDTGSEIVQEYLTDVYRRDIDNAEIVVQAEKIGWLNRYGRVQYMLGSDDFYKTYCIPDISKCDSVNIFRSGTAFLNVGNCSEPISIIWLSAHIAFTNYFFKVGGKSFNTSIYLRGATNLLKTSVVKVVANPFEKNRDNATTRMASTSAGVRYTLSMLPDTFVCIDDFSNTELTSRKKSLENAEDIIRMVGDGIFPVKMNVKDFSQGIRDSVRSTVILTGEEDLPLGASSHYRIVTLPIEDGTFNGETLRHFQNHPEVMAQYFALYVKYLTERGKLIIGTVNEKIAEYSNDFEQRFSVKRFIETAAFLKLQTDILCDFAIWCGIAEHEIHLLLSTLGGAVLPIMTLNQEEGTKIAPVKQFLLSLWQSLNISNNTLIADSEDLYIQNETHYLGFYEKNLLWLKPTDAYKIGVEFLRKQGQNFLVLLDTLKKMLLNEGYSKGVVPIDGKGGQYLLRAKKGSRKYMLVLHRDRVEALVSDLMNAEDK